MRAIDRTPEPGDVFVMIDDRLNCYTLAGVVSYALRPDYFRGPRLSTGAEHELIGLDAQAAYGLENRQVVVIPRSLIKQLLEVKNRELDEQDGQRELSRQIIDAANRAGDPEAALSPAAHQSPVPSAQSAQAGAEGSRGGGQAAQVPAEAPSDGIVYPLSTAGDSAGGR